MDRRFNLQDAGIKMFGLVLNFWVYLRLCFYLKYILYVSLGVCYLLKVGTDISKLEQLKMCSHTDRIELL